MGHRASMDNGVGRGGGSKRNTEKERFSVGLKVQGRRNESEGEVEDTEHGSGVAALTKGFGCHSRRQRCWRTVGSCQERERPEQGRISRD